MSTHYDEFEDVAIGKAMDTALLKRLLRYVRPYKKFFLIAFVFTVFATGIELALPYITKVAVDEVLVLPWVEVRSEEAPYPGAYELEEGLFLVDTGDMPQRALERLEFEGQVGERFLLLAEDDPGREGAARHPDVFEEMELGLLARERDLAALSAMERLQVQGRVVVILGYLALGFVLLLVLRFALTYGQVFLLQASGQRVMYDMRRDIFGHLLRLPVPFLDKQPVGRLVTRATNDIKAINEMYAEVLVFALRDFLMMGGVLAVMFSLNLRLGLLMLAFAPPLAVATFWFRVKARDAYRTARRHLARLNAYLAESISGMPIIQLFLQEVRAFRRFASINEEYFSAQMRTVMVYGVFGPTVWLVTNLALALLIWYGGRGVLDGVFTLGSLVAFISYIRMLFQPLTELSEKYNLLQGAMAAGERIFQLVDEPAESSGEHRPTDVRGEVAFEDVWFSYNERDWVLKGVSFRVAPGERIAVVGPTGSGKSTVVNLLLGFYRPQRGRILVDGQDLNELDLAAVRRRLALVPQDVFLFSGDVTENLAMWDPQIRPEDVRTAAEEVGVHPTIAKLPDGYETQVRERGTRLSVGERQLLSMARAVAADPRILVLDEATANVDSQTEALMQEALDKVMQGRTSIAIAHRLSTIRKADRVFVFREGHLVEEGSVSDLLEQKGLFWALWQLQFSSDVPDQLRTGPVPPPPDGS